MPYVSVSDVRALAPNVPINATSQPSEGIVTTWIADQERMADALFSSMGYLVPLTGPVGRTIAKQLITNQIMAMIMRARPNPETDPTWFQNVADGLLRRLRDPKDVFDITDAEKTVNAVVKNMGPRFSSNLRDLLMEEDRPRINRDQVF